MICERKGDEFLGHGGAHQLRATLDVFLTWADSHVQR
jgi:hypothetical protein